MPDRLPPPGPSFIREREIRVGDRAARVGMSRPTTLDDGWWLAVLWIADDDGVLSFRDFAPPAGPPPEPPLHAAGPAAGGRPLGPDPRGERPPVDPAGARGPARGRRPAVAGARGRSGRVQVGADAGATMRPNELADTVAAAFARAVQQL